MKHTDEETDLFYRKVLCASIEQAVNFATGRNLYTVSVGRYWRKIKTTVRDEDINYIMGPEFEYDMSLLGLDGSVEIIRREVRNSLQEPYQQRLQICNNEMA